MRFHPMAMLLALLPIQASATQTAHQFTTADLIQEASHTVHGRVHNIESMRTEDGRIVSRVQIDIMDSVPRIARRTVEYTALGGEIDGIRMAVAGSPLPSVGDEVVAFLQGDRVLGHNQGLFVRTGTAWTSTESTVGDAPKLERPQAVLGNRALSSSCARESIEMGQRLGWSTRESFGTKLRGETVRAVSVQVLAGVDYRLRVCDGGQADAIQGEVFDPDDRPIWPQGKGDELVWEFTAQQTGEYLMALEATALPEGVHRSAITILLEYR